MPLPVFEAEGGLDRTLRLPPSAGLLSRDFSNALTLSFIRPFRAAAAELSAGTDLAELRAFAFDPAGPDRERLEERAGEFEAEAEVEGILEAPPAALARRVLVGAGIMESSVCTTMSGCEERWSAYGR